VKVRVAAAVVWLALASASVMAQAAGGDVLGVHDLSPAGGSPISGGLSASCLYCHAPHSGVGGATPLWNQTLSTQTYTPYSSTTYVEKGNPQPPLGQASSLCLSCHDGTVAPGQTVAYKQIPMTGSMKAADVFGTSLQGSHPFSLVLPLKDTADLAASLVAQGTTGDTTGKVKLVKSNVECTSCHNPHVQAGDPINLNFLVTDSSAGKLCLACHDPNRVMTGQTNQLAGWATSAHAISGSKTANTPSVGGYPTVGQNACSACHQSHNAPGAARLLRGANEQDCIACHNGGANISPAPPNVFAEFAKIGHPFVTGSNVHDASESVLLNQNRHSTCADCHNPHASNLVTTFPPPPNVRPSQNNLAGISGVDGVTVLNPSVNQYENCLRCHGTSTGKAVNPVFGYLPVRMVSAGDPLNMIQQFALTSSSSHPVMNDRTSALAQPSLLANMLNIDGVTQGRAMGLRILCTDCHNSDDNREFGGTGASGPHGSKFTHILERRYEFSQAAIPGQAIGNLFPNPDVGPAGPYALCAKCHSLSAILANSSFAEHARHINAGFSCSVCHTAHGMGAQAATISGERLVNFDASIVAPSGGAPVSYNHATGSCTLTCHSHTHN
jgi:predicted CXXCH cytochrome family protein